jgi:hypothetical protein
MKKKAFLDNLKSEEFPFTNKGDKNSYVEDDSALFDVVHLERKK